MGAWRGTVATAVMLALGATAPASPAAGAIGAECPAIRPLGDIDVGDRGVGLTVERGTEPVQFDIEVVGLLPNALAPGRDLLLVEVSGAVIDRVGGIWAGMSGSPVYLDGELAGALGYAFSGSSRIAGVTPARDLVAVGGASARTSIDVPDDVQQVSLAGSRTVADSRLQPMLVPLAVGGLSSGRLQHLTASIERHGLPWFATAAGSAATGPSTTTDRPAPGDVIAASLAIGDLDAYAVGTVSYVCGDRVVAFGHPFFWSGDTRFGGHQGEAVAVISDPIFGAYVQATQGAMWGIVDQDRLAGIGGLIGSFPTTVPITSTVTDQAAGHAREGTSHLVFEDLLADLAASHLVANIDAVRDQVGRGAAMVTASIDGQRADGSAWTYHRTNRFADPWDISFGSVWELYGDLVTLLNQPIEEVTLTGIDVEVELDATYDADTIGDPRVSLDGGLSHLPANIELFVEGGQVLTVTVPLRSTTGGEERRVDVEVTVPDGIFGFGTLIVRAGAGFGFDDPFVCLYDPANCVDTDLTFDDLLAELANRPRNDELVVMLEIYAEGGFPPPDLDGEDGFDEPDPVSDPYEPARFETRVPLDRVAIGERYVPMFVLPSGGEEPHIEGRVTRLSGADRIATAIAVSESDFPFGAPAAVIARADDPVDAFAAVPLAIRLGAPILLSHRDGLPGSVADELDRLGATDAVIVGGTGALGLAVEDGLVDAGITRIDRLAGVDRADTARRVGLRLGTTGAVVVDGRSADIAAAASLAGLQGRAVLLADAGALPDATVAAISELGIREATLVGGTSTLPRSLQDALEDLDVAVDRIAGADRIQTALAVAERSVEMGADPTALVVASSASLVDALVASRLAAWRYAPLLLVGDDDGVVTEWIGQWGTRLVTIIGGTAAISADVEAEIASAVGQPPAGDGEPPLGEPTPGDDTPEP